MASRLQCVVLFVLPCSVRKRFNNTQLCRRKLMELEHSGGGTLGSTIRSPLTGSEADHAPGISD
jgi:hypothetical protein